MEDDMYGTDDIHFTDVVHGPMPSVLVHSAGSTALLGGAAVLIWNDIVDGGREQFSQWHDREHIPERLALPGFRRGRRFIRRGHSPEWLTMYEADDLDALTSPEYLARLNNPTPATRSTLRLFRNTSRAICALLHSVGSSTGGAVLTLRIEMPTVNVGDFVRTVREDLFPAAMAVTGVVACHLYGCDELASHIDTAESSTRAFDVPGHVLLVEATSEAAVDEAWHAIEGPAFTRCGVYVRPDAAIYRLEICRLAARQRHKHVVHERTSATTRAK